MSTTRTRESLSTKEEIIFSGEDYRSHVLNEIANAKSEILVSTYILADDTFGNSVVEELTKKGRQGVSVRMIVDGFGSLSWIGSRSYSQAIAALKLRIYHPLPWPISRIENAFPRMSTLFELISSINRRNHQKLLVFDRETALLGSRNLHNSASNWRETSLALTGSGAMALGEVFDETWNLSHDPQLTRKQNKKHLPGIKSSFILSNENLQKRKRHVEEIRHQLTRAKERIYITSPYFFPGRITRKILRERAAAGVDVKILLPRKTDVWLSRWIAQHFYRFFLSARIHLFEYSPKILHAKTLIIDEWAMVGSSNLNQRSATRDLEIDYVLQNRAQTQELVNQFVKDLKSSSPVVTAPRFSFLRTFFVGLLIKLRPTWF